MEMINLNRIKGTPRYSVASSFPFREKNFERKRSHVSQLKGQSNSRYRDRKLRRRPISLCIHNSACRTPRLEGISEGIEFPVCIVTS